VGDTNSKGTLQSKGFLGPSRCRTRRSDVDAKYGTLKDRYWDASRVFLAGAGGGVEYHGDGPWSVALDVSLGCVGEPKSALGDVSDADGSWTVPISLTVRSDFR
jgi:hypothetical protein